MIIHKQYIGKGKKIISGLIAVTVLTSTIFGAVCSVQADVINANPSANVSFTFDDGLVSASNQAAPTLRKYGLVGTDYVITGCVGMTTAPNTCHANTDATYMSWAQVTALQNSYGWEIASHTVTHPYLATSDASDGQPNVLTPAQVITELTKSKTALTNHGINATDFSTPYGDYNNAVLAQIAKYYASQRGFADNANNIWPSNDYLLYDMPVQVGVTVAQVKARIDSAIANKQWLILTMHDIKSNPSKNPDDYQYSTANLDQIAAYVKAKQTAGLLKSTTVSKGLISSDTNLLPNGSFANGIANGWRTDNASMVTADSGNNGSFPGPLNAVKFAPSATASRLYSPLVSVSSTTTYLLKNFLNVQSRSSGQIEFYIDEYDASGNWVSGQFKKAEASVFVENLNFTYTPSSPAVAKSDLQVTNTAGSGITAYYDNAQWFPISTSTQTAINLMTNGAFDSGIAAGWTTDNADVFKADASGQGSPNNPVNAVKISGGTATAHLFSPKIAVSSTQKYSLVSYLNLLAANGGEVAFYIDEYDTNGSWTSGQYKLGINARGAADVGLSYAPSSSSVASASLQIIVTSDTNLSAYFDDVRWYAVN